MSGRTRKANGRFIRTKVKNKVAKAVAAMSAAKKKKMETVTNPCQGKRIVDIQEIGRNLKCCKCEEVLSLDKITDEKRLGLHSIFTILCTKCSVSTVVHTNKSHKLENHKYSEVNTSIVQGAIRAESGCNALKKILSCENIPSLSKPTYKRYEQIVERNARDNCEETAEVEHRLVIENTDKICDNKPRNILKRKIVPKTINKYREKYFPELISTQSLNIINK